MTRYLSLILLLMLTVDARAETSTIHPRVRLLDASGRNVLETGQPISTRKTCAECHDTHYIESHSFHATLGREQRTAVGFVDGGRAWEYGAGPFGRWNVLDYRYLTPPGDSRLDLGVADWVRLFGARHVGGGPARLGHGSTPLEVVHAPPRGVVDPNTSAVDPTTGEVTRWNWQVSGTVEMNCFLCHTSAPDNSARIAQLEAGRFKWAGTATLASTGLVEPTGDGWQYNAEQFDEAGMVSADVLGIGDPTNRNCGLCHGQVHSGHEPLELELSLKARSTATTGRVFSPQRLSDSAVNLADKQRMGRPWDIHAERLVGCTDCHFSTNNPAFFDSTTTAAGGHLAFDPRRSSVSEYLIRPSHQFAKGMTAQGSVARHLSGTMRTCNDCHQAEKSHDWLPYQAAHFRALSCQACHIPHVAAPAVASIDWTVVTADGEPAVVWRGIDGEVDDPTALVRGFQPVLMPREEADGRTRLVPCNLIAASYWVDARAVPRPVPLADLEKAAQGGATDRETVRSRLTEMGYARLEHRTEVEPQEIHHGVVSGRWATRSCDTCHAAGSVLEEPMELVAGGEAGLRPKWAQLGSLSPAGAWADGPDEPPAWQPSTQAAGLYVLGHDGHRWIDVFGLLLLFGTLGGITVHGGLRIRQAISARLKSSSEGG